MQPLVQATMRTPGPSTVDPVVNECRKPRSPDASASLNVAVGYALAETDAKLERVRRLERDGLAHRRLRHRVRLRGTSG